jgi:hypothetical protein
MSQKNRTSSGAAGAHDAGKHGARRDADGALAGDLAELALHGEGGQDGPDGVVLVAEGRQAEDDDERGALVVHEELVERALVEVDGLLDDLDDRLDFLQADLGAGVGEVDAEVHEHDGEPADLRAPLLLVLLDVGPQGPRDEAFDLSLSREGVPAAASA